MQPATSFPSFLPSSGGFITRAGMYIKSLVRVDQGEQQTCPNNLIHGWRDSDGAGPDDDQWAPSVQSSYPELYNQFFVNLIIWKT